MEVSGQLHDPNALSPNKEPQHPLNMRLGEPQSRLDALEKKKMSCTCLESNPGHPACRYGLSCPNRRFSFVDQRMLRNATFILVMTEKRELKTEFYF
jgi:hypothetical protein